MSLISMPQWPEFTRDDCPPGLPQDLVDLLPGLHAACVVIVEASYEHDLLRALNSAAFISRVNGTPVMPGVQIVITSVVDSLIVALCSVFDPDYRGIDLKPIVNRFCDPNHVPVFEDWHRARRVVTEQSRRRLVRLQRRLGRNPFERSLERIRGLRRKGIAHIDLTVQPGFDWPYVRDITIVLAASANLTTALLHYATQRRFDVRKSRDHGLRYAAAFADLIRPLSLDCNERS